MTCIHITSPNYNKRWVFWITMVSDSTINQCFCHCQLLPQSLVMVIVQQLVSACNNVNSNAFWFINMINGFKATIVHDHGIATCAPMMIENAATWIKPILVESVLCLTSWFSPHTCEPPFMAWCWLFECYCLTPSHSKFNGHPNYPVLLAMCYQDPMSFSHSVLKWSTVTSYSLWYISYL